jgi:hypothetical protein
MNFDFQLGITTVYVTIARVTRTLLSQLRRERTCFQEAHRTCSGFQGDPATTMTGVYCYVRRTYVTHAHEQKTSDVAMRIIPVAPKVEIRFEQTH